MIDGRPFYRSLTVSRKGQPNLVAFWNAACGKWLFTKRLKSYTGNCEDAAIFAFAEDVDCLEKATTILLKRAGSLLEKKKKKGDETTLPALEQHPLYTLQFFCKSIALRHKLAAAI